MQIAACFKGGPVGVEIGHVRFSHALKREQAGKNGKEGHALGREQSNLHDESKARYYLDDNIGNSREQLDIE